MDAFINVNRKDPKVRIKINDLLERYNRLPPKYQSKIEYDTLIQNVILIKMDTYNGYYNNRFRYRTKDEI